MALRDIIERSVNVPPSKVFLMAYSGGSSPASLTATTSIQYKVNGFKSVNVQLVYP